MKGFSILAYALLASVSIAAAFPDIKSNKISPESKDLLKYLDSYFHDALTKVNQLRKNLKFMRGTGNVISNFIQRRQCNDVVSMLKALDEDIKEVQTMQLRESTIATSSKNNVAVNAFSNYVDNYRKIEYILRDIAFKLRKLGKEYKITNLPEYTVGLSQREVMDVQKKKLLAKEANEQAYLKLTAMRRCMKVFTKKFIKSRFLPNPFHLNRIDNHPYLGQKFEFDHSSNDISHNLYDHANFQY